MKGAKCLVLMSTMFLVAFLTAFPAYGEAEKDWHVSVGLNLGGYSLELEDNTDSFKTNTAVAVSPMIDFWYKKYGLGLSSMWSKVTFDEEGNDEEIDRMNFDLSLKYRINTYITVLTGARWENNSYDANTPGLENFEYKIQIYPVVGAAFSYPFACGATPFLVASYFPYAKIKLDAVGIDEDGNGFAGNVGVAYTFSIPVTVSVGFKYQHMNFYFNEDSLFYYGGVFYTF